MSKKIWIDDKNSDSVIKTKMHIDESENKYHFEDVQDVQPILERNKFEAKNDLYKVRGMQDAKMYKVASIPLIVVQQLAQQGIMSNAGRIVDKDRFKKWLNDPDNRHFRIYKGNV
tara:strand:+ start:3032 stop:3376 length:345 start_codon:yes stop_codon:yes gene_type:complete